MCPRPPRRFYRPPPPHPPPFMLSPPPLSNFIRERNVETLAHQLSLENNVAQMLSKVQAAKYSQNELTDFLVSAQSHLTGLRAFFDDFLPLDNWNECRTDVSTIAQRTFDVPELLEMIMAYLDIPDLLRVYQVNRGIRNAIDGSSKMQTKLCLRAAPPHEHLDTPFTHLTKFVRDSGNPFDRTVGFFCYHTFGPFPMPLSRGIPWPSDTISDAEQRTVNIEAYFAPLPRQRLPRMGTRIRRMYICQPPIRQMSVSVQCCSNYNGFHPAAEPLVLSSEVGLTIGDLYDYAEKLMEEHRWCPNAHAGQLEDNGVVVTDVRFSGEMVLQADDPAYLSARAGNASFDAQQQQFMVRNAKLQAYCNAKRQAHDNGQAIPTLTEFEATHGEVEDWISFSSQNAWPPPPPHLAPQPPFNLFPPPPLPPPPLVQPAPPPPITVSPPAPDLQPES